MEQLTKEVKASKLTPATKEKKQFFSFGADTSLPAPFFQTKLTINQPNDAFEQEADAMADNVMRMKDPAAQQTFFTPPTIQRKCDHCKEEEEKVQMKEAPGIQRQETTEEEPEQAPEETSAPLPPLMPPMQLRPPDAMDNFGLNQSLQNRGVMFPGSYMDSAQLEWGRQYGMYSQFGVGNLIGRSFVGSALGTFGVTPPGGDWNAWLANTTTPMAVDSALSRDFPNMNEEEERRGGLPAPTIIKAPAIHFKKDGSETGIDATAIKQTENYHQSLSGGKPLSDGERTFFEPRIGHDFSNVQLYTDSTANQSAKNVNALAYTHGSNIVFGTGQYQPETEAGKRLLAHELTHVVQQRSNTNLVQRDEAADEAARIAEEKKVAALTVKIKAHGIVSVDNGDATFTSAELELAEKAIAGLPAADKAAIKGAKLVRVSSLGSSAGMYSNEQGYDDTTVTDEQKIELSDKAFATGVTPAESIRLVTHEVGHAVASMPHRKAETEAIKAGANTNKKINEQNTASDEFTTANDALNTALDDLQTAQDTLSNTDITDKAAMDAARKDVEAKRKITVPLKSQRTTKEAKFKTAESATAAAQLVQQTKETAAGSTLANIDDLKTDATTKLAAMKAAYDAGKAIITGTDPDSADYRAAITSVEDAVIKFYDDNAAVDVTESEADSAKSVAEAAIADRNSKRSDLAQKDPNNTTLTTLMPVETAQDSFFKAATVLASNKAMNLSVKRFYDLVTSKGISPNLTQYAADNWPHKPEEFYAEAYSFFVTRPKDLEAHSKDLYDWFVAGKYK